MEEKLEKKLISSEERGPEFDEDKINKAVLKYGSTKQDPYSSANYLSRFFLYWAYKIIKLGNIVSLKTEYLGKVEGKYSSVSYLKSIKKIWETKGYKFKKTLPLVQAGFRSNIHYVIIVFLFSLFKTLINLLSIDLFREYMKRFGMKPEDIEKDNSYYKIFSHTQIGVICLGIKIFEIFFDKRCNEYQSFMGLKSGSEFQCLLFDKLLKVSPSSMKERAESGEVTNFLQIDSFRLSFLMSTSASIVTIPTNLIGYCYMLFKFFGFSFIFGIIVLLLFMLINVLFMRKFKKLHKKLMVFKDKRMKVITETFNNIKILKLYSWEDEFKNKINQAREDELNNMIESVNSRNLNSTIQWFAPVATSIASIGAYQYFHDTLKIEDIMTSLRIFNSIQGPIRFIPALINNFNEVTISMKRIEKYLSQDEINPGNVIKKDKYMDINNLSIKIVNGNYSWGVPPTSLAVIKMQDLKSRGISFDNFKKPPINKGFIPKKKDNLSQIELSTKFKEFDSQKSNNVSFINTDFTKRNNLLNKIGKIEGGLGLDFS